MAAVEIELLERRRVALKNVWALTGTNRGPKNLSVDNSISLA